MFVVNHLYKTHREVNNQITQGTKILSLTSGDLKFIDSLCFLPYPLSSFPDTFGITERCKGFFPHKFNTLANQRYVGPMPPPEMYDPEGMSVKKKKEFEEWYADKVKNSYVFKMRKEMEAYCISDVKLLKAGCEKFQQEFEQHAEFNPMEKSITIASACHRFWRKKLLPPQSIAVEPPRGWHGARTNQSVKAYKWMAYNESLLRGERTVTEDIIKHADNGGEQTIRTTTRSYLVDGYDATTKTLYVFMGCLWHGCPRCFRGRNQKSKIHSDYTFQELYEATKAKLDDLADHGYNMEVIWECDWDGEVKTNMDLQAFLQHYDHVEPLNPRHSFFGGRTNAVMMHHRVDQRLGEQIRYVDVTSLYPWVNKTALYPLGHPRF